MLSRDPPRTRAVDARRERAGTRPEKAFVKVVAKLLGLKFDQLWDRHRRRQRRQRLVAD